jgi:hypothetical protein
MDFLPRFIFKIEKRYDGNNWDRTVRRPARRDISPQALGGSTLPSLPGRQQPQATAFYAGKYSRSPRACQMDPEMDPEIDFALPFDKMKNLSIVVP